MTSFIVSMFVLGLVTSLHCVSMCGPLVLTYAVKGTEDASLLRRMVPHVSYQGAKIVSYMLVGLLMGWIGSLLDLEGIRTYVMFVAGAFMIVLGLGMTGRFPWALRLTPRPPRWLMKAIGSLRRKATADAADDGSSLATPIMFGLLTGLLPCAPLMSAQLTAATSGSALLGMAGMAAFALGTAPLMIAFGTTASLIPHQWKERMMVLLAVVVILFGFVFIDRGLKLTGAPVNSGVIKTALVGAPEASKDSEFRRGDDGVAEVDVVIENTRFVPDTVSIPVDEPVRLVVDRREASSCSDQLAIPQLGILKDLAPNAVTVVEIPATKSGSYTLTCGMGMMSGTLVAGAAGGGGSSPIPWVLLAGAALGSALYVSRRRDVRVKEQADRRAKKQASAPGSVMGFTPVEFILLVVAVIVALYAGSMLGGLIG